METKTLVHVLYIHAPSLLHMISYVDALYVALEGMKGWNEKQFLHSQLQKKSSCRGGKLVISRYDTDMYHMYEISMIDETYISDFFLFTLPLN